MIVVENITISKCCDDVVYNYYYRMLKGKIDIGLNDAACEIQSYGIEIERQDIVNGNIVNIERDFIKNISPQQQKVHILLKLLSDSLVSPTHLIDILGDCVDEYIIDFDKTISGIAL